MDYKKRKLNFLFYLLIYSPKYCFLKSSTDILYVFKYIVSSACSPNCTLNVSKSKFSFSVDSGVNEFNACSARDEMLFELRNLDLKSEKYFSSGFEFL